MIILGDKNKHEINTKNEVSIPNKEQETEINNNNINTNTDIIKQEQEQEKIQESKAMTYHSMGSIL